MASRFYAPDLRADEPFPLPRDESVHATRVLRLGPGDEVLVFDGCGLQVRGRIEGPGRGRVVVRPLAVVEAAPELPVHVTLVQAVLKSDAMDTVVRDVTMMGAASLRPVVSTRTNVSLATLKRRGSEERWRRVAIASAKQCGRAVVPRIESAVAFDTMAGQLSGADGIVLVEPSTNRGSGAASLSALSRGARPRAVVVVVGPEGGWTTAEVERAVAAGFEPRSLGPRTLRADAAGLVCLAVLQAAWGCLE